jgi:phosphopantothenoylcysteine decarboxylase/phosphopantothenate--cysteine ligase
MSILKGKEVVLGVTGCIAAYKAAELVRLIVKAGANVQVVMTESSKEFVSALTFQVLSGNPVVTDMFKLYHEKEIGHISLAQKADILVVAPSTANIIGKAAGGIADDMLSTVFMATKAPVLFAPAMNVNMWESPAVQKNIGLLKSLGHSFVEPEFGDLACGVQGKGRLAEVEAILEEMIVTLSPNDFENKRVLVTAGPTQESIDPARYLTNPSTGKMGFAIARALKRRGADVTLVTGPTAVSLPGGVKCVKVKTAEQMALEVDKCFEDMEIIIKSAAVADYRPKQVSSEKIKKDGSGIVLDLEKTSDILADLGKKKGKRILVGFAAETENLLANAEEKLKKKNLDMIVANDISRSDVGFGAEDNQVTLVFKDGTSESLPKMRKDEVADVLLDRILSLKSSCGE